MSEHVNREFVQKLRRRWAELDPLEIAAERILDEPLGDWIPVFRRLNAAGMLAASLSTSRAKDDDIGVAGLFLKRVLSDLRAIWLLGRSGYSTQAGACAAALFENSLVVCAVAGSAPHARSVLESQHGKIPWKVKTLCEMRVLSKHSGERTHPNFQMDVDVLYAQYTWLCNLKHPNIRSAMHDSGATGNSAGGYLIMPFPDTRADNHHVLHSVFLLSTVAAHYAITEFAVGIGPMDEYGLRGTFVQEVKEVSVAIRKSASKLDATKLPMGFPPDIAERLRTHF